MPRETELDLIIYHRNCPDGFCAAWVMATHFEGKRELHAAQYGEPPPDVAGKRVAIVDFSYKRQVMIELQAKAEHLVCLDHHVTAEQELKGLHYCRFDLNESGASLAWRYCTGFSTSALVEYVKDRDLWLWEKPFSREVSAWVMAQPHTIEAWSKLDHEVRTELAAVVAKGGAIRLHIEHYVDKMASSGAFKVTFDAYEVPCINAPMFNISDLLNKLCEGQPFAVSFWRRGDGKYQYSLRSEDPGGVDVSELARKYNGGGHKHAAGFESDYLFFV